MTSRYSGFGPRAVARTKRAPAAKSPSYPIRKRSARRRASLEWPAHLNDDGHRSHIVRHGQSPSELPSVPMLSALLRAAFAFSAFLMRDFAGVARARLQERGGLPRGHGRDLPLPVGQAPPPDLLVTRAKNLYELKNSRAGEIFALRFVAATGNAHDFGSFLHGVKRPRTATTGAKPARIFREGPNLVRPQRGP